MENSQKVGLGCGTLILIAVIVLIFGNAGRKELSQDIQQLRQQVTDLKTSMQHIETALGAQSAQFEDIRELLETTPSTVN